jgi:hypothetical protein
MPWDKELQVFAPNQNEYIYTNEWNGPFYGGFKRVIETFQRTEKPRRLKPVNIYYHFYSASKPGSLRALEKVYQWAAGQPLHSLTALQYVKTARDSREARFFQKGPRSWLLISKGDIRTLRIPRELGYPDMAASHGITGYAEERSWIYIHTSGQQRTALTLAGSQMPHLRLVSSSAEISFDVLQSEQAHFTAHDLRPVNIILGGACKGSQWKVTVNNGEPEVIAADSAGMLRLTLPAAADVTVEKYI